MKGCEARIFRYRLPFTCALHVKHLTLTEREGLIVVLRGPNGESGYGEIAPLPGFSEEDLAAAQAKASETLEAVARRGLVTREQPFTGWRTQDVSLPSVRFGLESALLSLQAAVQGHSPAAELSTSACDDIAINALLAGDTETVVDQAAEYARQGYVAFKLKVGRDPIETDIERVCAVREVLPSSVALRLDANRAWSFTQAIQFSEGVGSCALEYVEEPLSDPSRLPEFHQTTGVPYAVDETLQHLGWRVALALRQQGRTALEAFSGHPQKGLLEVSLGAAAWVVKPTLVGVPLTFFARETFAEESDVPIVVSSSFESGVGLISLANLAAALGDNSAPAGLDTQQWFAADSLRAPLPIDGGRLGLASANRLLNVLNDDVLEEVAHV